MENKILEDEIGKRFIAKYLKANIDGWVRRDKDGNIILKFNFNNVEATISIDDPNLSGVRIIYKQHALSKIFNKTLSEYGTKNEVLSAIHSLMYALSWDRQEELLQEYYDMHISGDPNIDYFFTFMRRLRSHGLFYGISVDKITGVEPFSYACDKALYELITVNPKNMREVMDTAFASYTPAECYRAIDK